MANFLLSFFSNLEVFKMKSFAVILTISLASNCWCLPANMPIDDGKPATKLEESTDTVLQDLINSLTMNANMLRDDPNFLQMENNLDQDNNIVNDAASEPRIIAQPLASSGLLGQDYLQLFKESDSGLEIEYDTTKLILKNNKPHQGHQHHRIVMKHYDELMPNRNFIDQPSQELENTVDQEQSQENLLDKEHQAQDEIDQQNSNMQDQNTFSPLPPNCAMKCENTLMPVCAINVHNKYAIFENICDMKVNNCINPELGWELLPREMCTDALHDFYLRLQKYFNDNDDTDSTENNMS